MAAFGGRFVVIGPLQENVGGMAHQVWHRWLSTDGASWEEASIPDLDDVALMPARLVAFDDKLVLVSDLGKHIQFWTSGDGISWQMVHDRADFAFARPGEIGLFGACAVPRSGGYVTDVRIEDGALIVEGTPPVDGGVCGYGGLRAVVRWASADAVHWARSIVAPNYDWDGSETPIRTASGFIRPWHNDSEDFYGVEASDHGVDWHVVWQTRGIVKRLGVFSGGFLAVGYAATGGRDEIVAAYSSDGVDWIQSTDSADMRGAMHDFVEIDAQLVVVGTRGSQTVVWFPTALP